MTKYEEAVESGAESLLGLFGENAPENAAIDIAEGYAIELLVNKGYIEAMAEAIWERYCNRLDKRGA
jgi:hypothetical protein